MVWGKSPQAQASIACPDPGLHPLNLGEGTWEKSREISPALGEKSLPH